MNSKLQLLCLLFIAGLGSANACGDPDSPCDDPSDVCDLFPCQNNGDCSLSANAPGYTCTCVNGYSGNQCETDPCVSLNPCQNSGVCSVSATTPYYTCACVNGYTGAQCLTDPCASLTPCQHSGVCSVSASAPYYTCTCINGYTGAQCQTVPIAIGQFDCLDGTSVTRNLVCDGKKDCASSGFDEGCTGAFGKFNCQDGNAIASNLVCNGIKDCKNGYDERCVAGNGPFNCADGTFIAINLICDGKKDCKNGLDEMCQGVQFKCGDGTLVAKNVVCDGKIDCRKTGLDEMCLASCMKPTTLPTTNIASNSFSSVYNIGGSSGTLTCTTGTTFPDGTSSKTLFCAYGTWSPAPSTIPASGCTVISQWAQTAVATSIFQAGYEASRATGSCDISSVWGSGHNNANDALTITVQVSIRITSMVVYEHGHTGRVVGISALSPTGTYDQLWTGSPIYSYIGAFDLAFAPALAAVNYMTNQFKIDFHASSPNPSVPTGEVDCVNVVGTIV